MCSHNVLVSLEKDFFIRQALLILSRHLLYLILTFMAKCHVLSWNFSLMDRITVIYRHNLTNISVSRTLPVTSGPPGNLRQLKLMTNFS